MANGRATVNGLRERMSGLEKLIETKFTAIGEDISDLKSDVKEFRKFQLKAIGAVGVLLALFQAALKFLPLILSNGK